MTHRNLPATALLAVASLAGCRQMRPLPVMGSLQDFKLISQAGRAVKLHDLEGKVWVADTFFSTCTGPCPMMSARMRIVGRQLASLPDVRTVSFTVDPAHDTPGVLAVYAHRFQAIPDRWLFLTGSEADLNRVCFDDLKLSRVNGSLEHSTRFVLLDRKARIRGYYLPFDSESMKDLLNDARFLAMEP